MLILNPNRDHVNKILNGIYNKEGHCPCQIEVSDDTLCPCKDFRESNECHCKLFIVKE